MARVKKTSIQEKCSVFRLVLHPNFLFMSTGIVLIIDDEEKLRTLLARIIRLEGYTVVEAENLKQGGKILEKEVIDVLLCDVKLPDGNGVDFVQGLKTRFPSLEVILLTA